MKKIILVMAALLLCAAFTVSAQTVTLQTPPALVVGGETYTVYVNYDLPDGDTWEVALLFVDDAYETLLSKQPKLITSTLLQLLELLQLI